MATFTASSCQTNASGFFLAPPKYNEKGVQARTAQYTFTAAQSAGDVIQMVPVPKGAVIHELNVVANMGGAAITVTGGDGGSAARYGSMSVQGALVARCTAGIGYSYSADDTIDLTVSTVTSASAAGSVRLTVLYSFDQAADGGS